MSGGKKGKKGAARFRLFFAGIALLLALACLAPEFPVYRLTQAGVSVYYSRGRKARAEEALVQSRAYLAEMDSWLTGQEGESRPGPQEASAGVNVVLGGPQPLSNMGNRRRTAGYYWQGIVVICDPEGENPPLSHELAHWHLEKAAGGEKLPRWFSEGYAQYAEYRLTGFALPLTDGVAQAGVPGADLPGGLSLTGLDPLFEQESTQLTAYYLSFRAFNALLEETGWPGIALILEQLNQGATFEDAFLSATGLDFCRWERKISSYFVEIPLE